MRASSLTNPRQLYHRKKVLFACEESGVGRDIFIEHGYDAWSCDLKPGRGVHTDKHIQADVLTILDQDWDRMIAHPDCTYLTNAANRWLYEDSSKSTAAERLVLRESAIEFFLTLKNADIEEICIENPEPHPYVISLVGHYSDKVQPWMFGDPETKGLCLWLKNLPPLMSTMIETTREDKKHRLPPSPERAALRSESFPGVMQAMARQWHDHA